MPDESTRPLPRTYQVRTYGCQMNVHDSERRFAWKNRVDSVLFA